jgi:hypothetical protein
MRKWVLVLLVLTLGLFLGITSTIRAETPRPQEFRGNVIVNGNSTPQGSTVAVRTGGIQIASVITDSRSRYGFNSPLLVSTSSGSLLEFYVNGIRAQETANCKYGEVTLLDLTVNPDLTMSASGTAKILPAVTASTGNYTVSNLNVSPSSVNPGQPVNITVDVKNNGATAANSKIAVLVNGTMEIEQSISLASGKTQKLTYTLSKENPGDYNIVISNQNVKFSVVSSSASRFEWSKGIQWWIYVIGGIVLLLIILIVILIISRRNSGYF